MNKSKIMLLAAYCINIFLLIGVIIFYNRLNSQLETELLLSSKYVENPEFENKLIARIQAGKTRNEEYISIFKKQFELEKARYENERALIELNSSIKEVIASLLLLQLLFLTLYIKYGTKNWKPGSE